MDPLPNVVAVEPLPDGRKVITFRDRDKLRDVVFGLAASPGAGPGLTPRGRAARAAEQKANELLESLLDPAQLADWRATGTFWVDSRRGPVQLGRLYSLLHWPEDRPDEELVLCVVPDRHQILPKADIWANLLLVLRVCPDQFFDVANLVSTRRRRS
jgi:hypothetical protein